MDVAGNGVPAIHAILHIRPDAVRHDDGVIHHQAEGNDDAGYRHLVNIDAKQLETAERQQGGQWQGKADNNRRAPAHGNQQDQQHNHQTGAQITHQATQAILGIGALIEQGSEFNALRQGGFKFGHHRAGCGGPDIDADIWQLAAGDGNAGAAINGGDNFRRVLYAALDRGHIGQAQAACLIGNQRDSADTLGGLELAVDLDRQPGQAAIEGTGGCLGIGIDEGTGDAVEGQSGGGQCLGIDDHLDLLIRCAGNPHDIGTGNIAHPILQRLGKPLHQPEVGRRVSGPLQSCNQREGIAAIIIEVRCARIRWQGRCHRIDLVTQQRPDRLGIGDRIFQFDIDDRDPGA